jgi:hypothetical protein
MEEGGCGTIRNVRQYLSQVWHNFKMSENKTFDYKRCELNISSFYFYFYTRALT